MSSLIHPQIELVYWVDVIENIENHLIALYGGISTFKNRIIENPDSNKQAKILLNFLVQLLQNSKGKRYFQCFEVIMHFIVLLLILLISFCVRQLEIFSFRWTLN